jgi:hypothetical protein
MSDQNAAIGLSEMTVAITLKARSELCVGCDVLKVARVLDTTPQVYYVRDFELYAHRCEPAHFTVTFAADEATSLEYVVGRFLDSLRYLPDCHRICETLNFADEYDGTWDREPHAQLDHIRGRLREKMTN